MSLKLSRGHLGYVLDDSYIHMAISKNFSQYGVWGISRFGFTSSSSSPLWILLLSLIYFFSGPNELAPFVVNIIFGIIICILAHKFFKKYRLQPFLAFIFLVLVIFLTPLPLLIFCGQEHTMHLLISISFLYVFSKNLSKSNTKSSQKMLLVLAPLLTASRYEGLFLLLVVCIVFLLKRKFLYALFLGGLGLLPVVLYGSFSLLEGWHFLPNSVFLKADSPDFSNLSGIINLLGYTAYKKIIATPHILALAILMLTVYFSRLRRQFGAGEEKQLLVAVFLITVFLHMQFARTGWFYRYEAYLVSIGVLLLGVLLKGLISESLRAKAKKMSVLLGVIILFFIFALLALIQRGAESLRQIPRASVNIYEQQYQIGLFLREFYHGQSVAAHDIGAINYLADVKCLDLYGIGTKEIAEMKISKNYNLSSVIKFTAKEKIKIAVVYDSWLKYYRIWPINWIKVGEWKIKNNVACGDDTVSFYAVNPREKNNLAKSLEAFSSRLPENVRQRLY